MLKNPGILLGYHNLPDETAKRLRDGWYYSGDICRRDADGFYYFVGRTDDMFVSGGENIFPGEVEALLLRHPGVHQALVMPFDHELKGQVPYAFVVPSPAPRSPRTSSSSSRSPTDPPTSTRGGYSSWTSFRWRAPTRWTGNSFGG